MSGNAECKACGNALLEGRAYELGGHRWHVECFRCSVCENQLHAHTNMLVLGDGTLVCSNCSYTCSLCSRKITDMAILTNDQAFCADCFVCRNCKRQIDDLQYARTSQGIFCMNCHNALLARKRQRQKQKAALAAGAAGAAGAAAIDASAPDAGEGGAAPDQDSPQHELSSRNASGLSSRSSVDSSWNRNKALPGLPNLVSSTASLVIESETSGFESQNRRELKVPRKKLAPSALAEPLGEPLDPSDSSDDLVAPQTPSQESPSLHAEMLEPLDTPPRSTSYNGSANNSGNSLAEPPTPEAAAALSHHSTPPASLPGSTPSSAPSVAASTPASANGVATAQAAAAALNVPQRSQLRPASPARSWRGFKSPARSSKDGIAQNGAPGSPASTSAAAPFSPAKSTISSMSKFWHRRDASTGSVDAASVQISAPLTPSITSQVPVSAPASSGSQGGHKRSLSESGQLMDLGGVEHNELAAALAAERNRVSELEAQINFMYSEIGTIDSLETKKGNLRAEVAELEEVLAKTQEKQRILSSKNSQLMDMNQELERRTIEKFGPNSLWGSQNPPPAASAAPPAPADGPPLVTRLDGASANGGASSNGMPMLGQQQAQPAHPLRSAKQWFLRRPNRAQQQNGGPSNGALGGGAIGGMAAGAVGSLPGSGGLGATRPAAASSASSDDSSSQTRTLIGDSLSVRTGIDQASVPYIVTRCFAEVERRGLDVEGIYRKPGSKSQVDAIMELFAAGDEPDLEDSVSGAEIQAITSAAKQYLRYLSMPVITYDCYDSFIAAGNSRSVSVLRHTVQALPAEHRDVLRAIASHLALVASHESANLMNIRNLAMVFAPTIARDESGEREIMDMQARNEATQLLITNATTLLEPAVDELL